MEVVSGLATRSAYPRFLGTIGNVFFLRESKVCNSVYLVLCEHPKWIVDDECRSELLYGHCSNLKHFAGGEKVLLAQQLSYKQLLSNIHPTKGLWLSRSFLLSFCGNLLCVPLRPQKEKSPPNLEATDKRIYFVVVSSFPPTQTKSKVFFFLSSFPPKNNSSSPTSDSPLAKTRNYCFLPYTATAVQQLRQGRAHFSKKELSLHCRKNHIMFHSHF